MAGADRDLAAVRTGGQVSSPEPVAETFIEVTLRFSMDEAVSLTCSMATPEEGEETVLGAGLFGPAVTVSAPAPKSASVITPPETEVPEGTRDVDEDSPWTVRPLPGLMDRL